MLRAIALLPALAVLVACVPPVEEAPTAAAETYCAHSVECGWIVESEIEGCIDTTEDVFEAFWNPEDCAQGFSREGWSLCMDNIEQIECDDLLSGLIDIADDCDLLTVCPAA